MTTLYDSRPSVKSARRPFALGVSRPTLDAKIEQYKLSAKSGSGMSPGGGRS